jgi:hypothetical protein
LVPEKQAPEGEEPEYADEDHEGAPEIVVEEIGAEGVDDAPGCNGGNQEGDQPGFREFDVRGRPRISFV